MKLISTGVRHEKPASQIRIAYKTIIASLFLFWLLPFDGLAQNNSNNAAVFLIDAAKLKFASNELETSNNDRLNVTGSVGGGFGKMNNKKRLWAIGASFGFTHNSYTDDLETKELKGYTIAPFLLVQQHFQLGSSKISLSPFMRFNVSYGWQQGQNWERFSSLNGHSWFANWEVCPLTISFATRNKNSFFFSAGSIFCNFTRNVTKGTDSNEQAISTESNSFEVDANLSSFRFGIQKNF